MERVMDPCQAICRFDDDDVCIGCFRKREEVNSWRFMDDEEKRKIVEIVKPKIKERLEKERAEGRIPPTDRFTRA